MTETPWKLGRGSSLAILCLPIVLFFLGHCVLFFAKDGLCFPGGDGRVAGNDASGAGALPRLYHDAFKPFVSLDLSRPASGSLNSASFIAVCALVFFAVCCLLRRRFRQLTVSAAVLVLVLSSVLIENSLSCELRLTHRNIAYIFHERPKRVRIAKVSTNERTTTFSVSGREGEPTCKAFVVTSFDDPRRIDMEWRDLSAFDTYMGSLFPSLPSGLSNPFPNIDPNQVFVSSSLEKTSETSKYIMSMIVCRRWPCPWFDQMP